MYNDDFSVESLVKEITKFATAYYRGQAMISDSDFDSLVERLREISPDNPILSTPGWGYVPTLNKASHKYGLVGSLGKYRDCGSLLEKMNSKKYIITPKYDGLSCVAYYNEKGELIKAVTRGNGSEGIDITDKFIYLSGKTYIDTLAPIAVRGELIISDSNFDKLKVEYPGYKNSRNAVAGIINSKELSKCLSYVDFVPYKIHGIDLSNSLYASNYEGNLKYLRHNFENATDYVLAESFDSKFLLDVKENHSNGYPCDGVVVTSIDTAINEDGLIEYNQYAYKFEDEKVESRVDHIEWNLTRTGKLAPVACIDPVELDGATIKRVTCFNAQYIKDNRIGPDAYVEIQRSGMVIPDIQRVTVECPSFTLPDVCSSCGNPLTWSGTDLVCDSAVCESQTYSKIYQWIKQVGGIKGVSRAGIDEIIRILDLKCVRDLYTSLDRHKCYEIIDSSVSGSSTREKYKKVIDWLFDPIDPVYFFLGMNLKGIGWNTALALSEKKIHERVKEYPFVSSSQLEMLESDIYSANNCGYAVFEEIYNNLEYMSEIANLIDFSSISHGETSSTESDLRNFCVTGSLEMGSRSDFCLYASQYGWVLADIKDSEFLVTNNPDPSSSKSKKAKDLGIPIVTEKEFIAFMKSNDIFDN